MPKNHIDEIDFQRAILISLVILVHIVNFGNIHPDVKGGILSFLMPTFLMITGYLTNVNKPIGKFAVYLLRILLPYVILVTGYMVLSLYLPVRDGIQQLDLSTTFYVLCIRSIGPYWFFRVMLICAFLYYVTFRCLSPKHSTLTMLMAYGIALLLVCFFTPILNWKHAVYYFMGVALRQSSADYNKLFAPTSLAILPLLLILFIDSHLDLGSLLVIILGYCFLSFAAYLKKFCHGKPLDAILYLGRNTLPIYMFHPIFTMAGKYLQPIFRFDESGIAHAIVVIIISLAGSLLLAKALDQMHITWIFGRPRLLR